jgi:hypothetical protein
VLQSITKKNGRQHGLVIYNVKNQIILVRTILEAIIAFFPIKEDHDAIGAIDYPIQVRKKYATLSRKWKCESCGPIITQLPEKKPKTQKIESDTISPIQVNEININQEIDPNKADLLSPENKPIKKPAKLKKIDLDRRSHLSNVGQQVIIEDVNEYEDEAKEEIKLELNIQEGKRLQEPELERNTSNLENNFKRMESNQSANSDFSDYLKRLRSNQFAEKTDINEVNRSQSDNNLNKLEDEKETIQFKTQKSRENSNININGNISQPGVNNIPNNQSFQINQNQINKNQFNQMNENINVKKNTFIEHMEDDFDFYLMSKNIKFHKTANPDEIMTEIYNDKLEKLLTNPKVLEHLKMSKLLGSHKEANSDVTKLHASLINAENSHNNNEPSQPQQHQQQQKEDPREKEISKGLLTYFDLFNNKEKLEQLFKQKNNALKYCSRKAYKDARSKRIFIINFVMVIIIGVIFTLYIYAKSYF